MTDLKPCPIPTCKYVGQARDALFGHLYTRHLKAELITWILNHLEG